MFENLKSDFRGEISFSGYDGKIKKMFHALTSPGFQAVAIYRLTHWLYRYRIPVIGMILQRLIEVWTGISISPKATIGPGLALFHFGGIVISGNAVIGSNCALHHGVTIGNRHPGGSAPILGDRVMVGAGAKLLGGIRIGRDAKIGANAVVLIDVPDEAIAVGVPARIVKK